MITQATAVLSALASRLPSSPGRRQRRRWVGNGRAHVEVRGLHRPENRPVARHLEHALADLDGVEWAQVNTVAGRVIVAFDGDRIDADGLVDVIEGVEDAHDLSGERFPHDRPIIRPTRSRSSGRPTRSGPMSPVSGWGWPDGSPSASSGA